MADVNGSGAGSPFSGMLKDVLAQRLPGGPSRPGVLPAEAAPVPLGKAPRPGPAGPSGAGSLADLPGVLPVSRAVVRELQDAVSQDLVEHERGSEARLSAEDQLELARSLVAKRVSAWSVEHARKAAPLSPVQLETVRQAIINALFKAGPLQQYLEDASVENIVVDGDRVWVDYFDRATRRVDPVADDDESLVALINRLAVRSGHGDRILNPASPMVNFRLPDRSRVAATLLTSRPTMAIRRHRVMSASLEDMVGWGTLSPAISAFLQGLVAARQTVLIAGDMGVGKTSLLRALVRKVGPGERIVTLESDRELFLDEDPEVAAHVLAMEERAGNGEVGEDGRETGRITIADMYPHTLRMLSTRVVVGEVRSTEVVPMLDAMSSGGRGSMCTLHAAYPRLVLPRLVQLCQGAGMDVDSTHQLVANAVNFVVFIRQTDQTQIGGRRHRYVSDILQVTPGEGGRPAFSHVFAPPGGGDPRGVPRDLPTGEVLQELADVGFDKRWLAEAQFGRWPRPMELVRR
ncbi:CpaF family protein [Streptomyces pinistramenti]|uniref:CpaF family protein n=1 Tax=Streptomyces pinistramenti TaxID=2884812 RepID=UPI001D089776|nr:ATPase, T2SS/T4P/T4SS family [Streptomyces pinistramenti]MCB5910384.1 Flp pilus assembly complex ATPase component TadA [Streptomyces pinistramenti]